MDEDEKRAMWAHVELAQYGQEQLGIAAWRLLCSYGKLMTGPPLGGLYVSGIPCEVAKEFVDALVRGETVDVHLMHRHRSGNYESSSLCLRDGRLVMIFDDREELA
jgi:hypothetical protein